MYSTQQYELKLLVTNTLQQFTAEDLRKHQLE